MIESLQYISNKSKELLRLQIEASDGIDFYHTIDYIINCTDGCKYVFIDCGEMTCLKE
jgi:hypothetical protein